MKKILIIIVIVLALLAIGWYIYSQSEEPEEPTEDNENGEEVAEDEEEENGEDEEDEEDEENGEDEEEENGEDEEDKENGEDEEADESETDDPYANAEEVEVVQDLNTTMHEDFAPVLEEVFEKEPKLVETGDILILSYVVDRPITSDDVKDIREMLQERGYESEGTDAKEDAYDLNFSAEILDQEYNNNIYVLIHTTEEGEEAQKIEVRIL
ncbi:MAG: SpoIIIAH-like family protein [Candidatus Paceibacterota bacterium]